MSACLACDANAVADANALNCLCQQGTYLDDWQMKPNQSTASELVHSAEIPVWKLSANLCF